MSSIRKANSRHVTATIYEVLGDLRAQALDERGKGDKFERLVKTYLLNDPEWANRFSDVWLWSEWPGREGRPDTGIDLVAACRDEDGYAAIQCKFYAPGATVAKGDIDSFLSASGGKEFTPPLRLRHGQVLVGQRFRHTRPPGRAGAVGRHRMAR